MSFSRALRVGLSRRHALLTCRRNVVGLGTGSGRTGFVVQDGEAPALRLPGEDEGELLSFADRPGRESAVNLAVAATGVRPAGLNCWGQPSDKMLKDAKCANKVSGKGGAPLVDDDEEGLNMVREALSSGVDLYAVFGSVGSGRGTRLSTTFVTDCANMALAAKQLLHAMPEGALHLGRPRGPLCVVHSMNVPGVSSLVFEGDHRAIVGAGKDTSVTTILQGLAKAAADMAPEGSLPVAGSAYVAKDGASSLVVGEDDAAYAQAAKAGSLYAAHGAFVTEAGLSAMFDAAVLPKGAGGVALAGDNTAIAKLGQANLAPLPGKVLFLGASGNVSPADHFDGADAELFSEFLGNSQAVGASSAKEALR